MGDAPNRFELVGYLEEALPTEEMAKVEDRLRNSESWREALRELTEEVGTGDHSLATVWRRNRLTCLSRERLGAYLVGGLVPQESEYARFHLEIIQCRWCLANLRDVETQQSLDEARDKPATANHHRRRKFFETSVGYLPKGERRP